MIIWLPEKMNVECSNKLLKLLEESGIDLQAGLTVHSIVSTHIYRNLPSMARSWYLMADCHKFGQIAMYPVADLDAFQYLIADDVPEEYRTILHQNHTEILLI